LLTPASLGSWPDARSGGCVCGRARARVAGHSHGRGAAGPEISDWAWILGMSSIEKRFQGDPHAKGAGGPPGGVVAVERDRCQILSGQEDRRRPILAL
jgi:hypothetical protein